MPEVPSLQIEDIDRFNGIICYIRIDGRRTIQNFK